MGGKEKGVKFTAHKMIAININFKVTKLRFTIMIVIDSKIIE